jgi:hypothetical protein
LVHDELAESGLPLTVLLLISEEFASFNLRPGGFIDAINYFQV